MKEEQTSSQDTRSIRSVGPTTNHRKSKFNPLTSEVYLNNVQRLNYILTANMPPVR